MAGTPGPDGAGVAGAPEPNGAGIAGAPEPEIGRGARAVRVRDARDRYVTQGPLSGPLISLLGLGLTGLSAAGRTGGLHPLHSLMIASLLESITN